MKIAVFGAAFRGRFLSSAVCVVALIISGIWTSFAFSQSVAPNGPFPRIASVWTGQDYYVANPSEASQIQLFLGPNFTTSALSAVQASNPNATSLMGINLMETTGGQPVVPSSYYLLDTNGNQICNWPGNPPDYILNLTNPTVAKFVGQYAAQQLQNNPQYNGVFFDNLITNIGDHTTDCYGNPIKISSQGNGVADNPVTLNQAWVAGLYTAMNTFRSLAPNAYAVVHGNQIPPDSRTQAAANGDAFGFSLPQVREGTLAFGNLWDSYNSWFAIPNTPIYSTLQGSVPSQLAYGYGYTPATTALPQTAAFAQSFYPNMRFGLGFSLMNNGFFEHDFGDNNSFVTWWYDEYNFNLGQAAAPAQLVGTPASANAIGNSGFENGLTSWRFGVATGGAATASIDNSTFVDGTASAHVNVTTPTSASYQICLEQDGLSLIGGQEYTVQFWAKSDTPLPIQVSMQGGSPSYLHYGLSATVQSLTGWNPYSLSFIASQSATDGRLEFNLGSAAGNIWIDGVSMVAAPQRLYRRDFQNGVVLLNGTNSPQTFSLEAGLSRFSGSQAPRYQYIVDDSSAAFSATGSTWAVNTYDTGWRKPSGPYYHAWNATLHELDSGPGTAQWNLQIPADGQYTIQIWLPAAPSASTWTNAAQYQISQGGTILGTVTLNQANASQGDQWFNLGTFNLSAAGNPVLTLQNNGAGPLIADAVYVFSASDKYNDGSAVTSVTLQPMDAILLKRQAPSQTITFSAPGSQIVGAPLALNAVASSGLAVSYRSNTPNVCQISGNAAQLTAAGTCSITAAQSGGSGYTAAVPVTVSFQVFVSQAINVSSVSTMVLGSPAQAVSAVATSGLPVALSASPASVCSLSGQAVNGVGAGLCTVTASQSGNVVYAPAPAVPQSFSVLATQAITFPAIPLQALGGLPINPGATASSGLPVSYSSGTPGVCSVSGSSVVLSTYGTCTVTALQAGNSLWAAASPVSQSFTVVPNLLINGGFETGALTPWTFGAAAPAAATGAIDNTVAAAGADSAKINVTTAGSAMSQVVLYQGSLSVTAGSTYTIAFWATSSVARSIQLDVIGGTPLGNIGTSTYVNIGTGWNPYSVSFTSAATVTNARLEFHFANAASSVWLDNVQLYGSSGMFQSITWAQPPNVIYGTAPVALGATSSSGMQVLYSSNTPSVCSVSGSQAVVLSGGTCSLTATQPGNSVYQAAQPVTQSFQIATESQSVSFPAIADVVWGVSPFSVPVSASSGLVVTLTSNTPAVCNTSGNTITAVAAGSCSITATQAGNISYATAAPVTQAFSVLQLPQTVTLGAIATQGLGGLPFTVNPSSTSGLAVQLSSNNATVCTVSGNAVTLLATGTCSLTASQPGNANVAAAVPVTQTFNVVPNLLSNAGFETGTLWPWAFGTGSPAVATAAVDTTTAAGGADSAKINVTTPGTSVSQVVLYQGSLSVTAGKTYTISFWAYSNVARSIQLDVLGGSPLCNVGANSYVNIGTGWGLYTLTFTPTTTATNARLEFHFGNAASTVWLDNVQLFQMN